ncbi:MAG: hypothetical protein COS71_00740 [Candidatus Moranbacteria bacterium CG06_land_8_20_14_3_00_40_12]|nr:MAG: hypothetical protein COS71_00740 [Candidatus Moranbacteria bacterium CG06_land_8_20_14_3_00_40_12]
MRWGFDSPYPLKKISRNFFERGSPVRRPARIISKHYQRGSPVRPLGETKVARSKHIKNNPLEGYFYLACFSKERL